MAAPASTPSSLTGQVYPNSSTPVFPEQSNSRYSASSAPIGVCFSGGGARAMSSAMGQMRGIMASPNFIDAIGAISCVSGGTWFGSIYTYASSSIDDATLLGPVTAPQDITVAGLQNMNDKCVCYPITGMSNSAVLAVVAGLEIEHKLSGLPYDRFWDRLLNFMIYSIFGLDDTSTFFSLDTTTVNQILAQNSSLSSDDFYIMRSGRPFFIAGGTQIYPTGENFIMRHFEYTAQYSGTAQEFPQIGPAQQDFGYGYCDNFIFNTETPGTPNGSLVTVDYPSLPFLISDAGGSSSAAIGAASEDLLGTSSVFPSFDYWPMTNIGNEDSTSYGFEDGGNLENVGIVPLLRRQYPLIIAFVNSSYPIGSTNENCIQGVDGQISRLFGLIPKPTNPPPGFNDQDTQVFNNDSDEFTTLATALAQAKQNGEPIAYGDLYTIQQNNAFDIPQYPDSGQVAVVWVYNDINGDWKSQLTQDVQNLLSSTDRTNYMANFPNYKTVGQNETKVLDVWVPEVLMFTPQQLNLLADMQCYTIMTILGSTVNSLAKKAGVSL